MDVSICVVAFNSYVLCIVHTYTWLSGLNIYFIYILSIDTTYNYCLISRLCNIHLYPSTSSLHIYYIHTYVLHCWVDVRVPNLNKTTAAHEMINYCTRYISTWSGHYYHSLFVLNLSILWLYSAHAEFCKVRLYVWIYF